MPSAIQIQRLNTLLKLAIGGACLWFLYHELFVKQEFSTLWQQFKQIEFSVSKYFVIELAFFLVLLNWGLETSKWKMLISTIEKVNWITAFKAVISGITISLFTPNRVGEFAARIFYLQSNHRIKGILISIIGSLSQLCITIVVGSFCFTYFLIKHQSFNAIEQTLILIVPFVISFGITILYFNMDLFRSLLLKINRGRKARIYLNVFTFYNARQLMQVLMLSALRFIVFSLQYYLLFQIFDIQIPILTSFMLTSSIFFVLAIIPTIALAELGIRGVTAIYFLKYYASNELNMLSASYGLWCINLAFPALLGLVFLSQLNFFRK